MGIRKYNESRIFYGKRFLLYYVIAERVYRGTCLDFTLQYKGLVEGWVTGIDDDVIQICTFDNQDIILISRSYIVTVEEHLTSSGKPYKISDIPDKEIRDQVNSYTKKLTQKAKEFKNIQ